MPLALAAVAQTIVVISGGIDLSIASVMALTNVVAAVLMLGRSDELGVGIAVGVLLLGLFIGAVNGILIVWTRVADIIVTLRCPSPVGFCAVHPAGSATLRRMHGCLSRNWRTRQRVDTAGVRCCCRCGCDRVDPATAVLA